jgi:hypothetical protein
MRPISPIAPILQHSSFPPPMIADSKNRLIGLTRELAADWAATKDHWRDAKSMEFEKRFIEDLMGSVNVAVVNIDTLERVLNKVREDCE